MFEIRNNIGGWNFAGQAFFCIILIFGLVLPCTTIAQNRIQIVEADSIVGGTSNGRRVRKILGNVHLRAEGMDMFADRAYEYPEAELVEAYGNIQINTGEEIIWADTLIYFTDIDFSRLRGRVIIKSDSTTLFGNKVDYRFTNNVAHFLDEIRLEDPSGILIAQSGFYFRRADSAVFHGQVQLLDSLQYVEGDHLFTNRKKGYYELHDSVFAFDKENSTKLSGDYLEADSTGRNIVIGNAWLKNFKEDTTDTAQADTLQPLQPDSASLLNRSDTLQPAMQDSLVTAPDSTHKATSQPDTTHIRAHRIVSIQHRSPLDTTTTTKAYQNVRIWSPDFSSVSDSARYESKTNVFELYSNAKAWYNQIQLTSPYIWVKLEDSDIKKLIAYPKPFTVKQDTAIGRLNQIKGDTLKAFFSEGELQKIAVYPNSHLLRFTKENNQPDGAIELTAPKTNIFFENGELTELKALGKDELVNGYYRPENEETASKELNGFSWNPDLRPQRPEKQMKRRFPPIPDGPPFELPEKYLEYVNKGKKQKIE